MHAYRQKIREIPKSIMSKFWIIIDSSLTLHALVYITMLLLKNLSLNVLYYIMNIRFWYLKNLYSFWGLQPPASEIHYIAIDSLHDPPENPIYLHALQMHICLGKLIKNYALNNLLSHLS